MSANGELRLKRRTSPPSVLERPKKQLKQENGVPTPGDATPMNGSVYDIEAESSSLPVVNTVPAAGDSPEWQATIERVIKSVVSIHFCQTCSFDTDLSLSSQATGFVVDAENGYIMTNRHVVCAGPFWGYCVFDNHEEVGCSLPTRCVALTPC
jgi:pro-apoptotic serine protease NMA111